MKRFFILLFLIISQAFAQEALERKTEEQDMDALRKWIREKRMITLKELGGDLSISGEVRVEYQGFNEKKAGIRQRGHKGATSKAANAFDVEANLMLDYQAKRTWASIKLEFDNDMGLISGTTNHLSLEKAYFGGRMVDGDTFNFDGELGRRNLGDVFDSKIEFAALFDGLLLKFNKAFESIGNFYFNLGAFVVDDYYNHFGEVAELGMLRISNTGLFIKYSFINWKRHYSDPLKNRRFNFGNSQLQLGYQGTLARWDKFIKIYFAGLINHFAHHLKLLNEERTSDIEFGKKYNLAAYAGISYGRILKANDWAVDINYQYVMPQAVPDYDSNGIKRGNAGNVGLYTQSADGTGGGTTISDAVGNANFQGLNFDLLYAITNNLTLFQNIQISTNQTKRFGPTLNFRKYEMEFIYNF